MLDLPADQGGVSEAERVSVWEAMKALASDEREIVMLATVQGYTTREVSEMLGIPHGTVSSKLHRTLKKLRKILE